jgi:hypothetical protein
MISRPLEPKVGPLEPVEVVLAEHQTAQVAELLEAAYHPAAPVAELLNLLVFVHYSAAQVVKLLELELEHRTAAHYPTAQVAVELLKLLELLLEAAYQYHPIAPVAELLNLLVFVHYSVSPAAQVVVELLKLEPNLLVFVHRSVAELLNLLEPVEVLLEAAYHPSTLIAELLEAAHYPAAQVAVELLKLEPNLLVFVHRSVAELLKLELKLLEPAEVVLAEHPTAQVAVEVVEVLLEVAYHPAAQVVELLELKLKLEHRPAVVAEHSAAQVVELLGQLFLNFELLRPTHPMLLRTHLFFS